MFTIDFTKPWLYKDIVYFNQGNFSSNNILRCKVVTGGDDTLEGYNGSVTFKTLSSKEVIGTCKVVNMDNCMVDIYFPANALEVGVNTLEIILTKSSGGNEVVAQSPAIKYEVWQGLTTGNGIQSDNNYPILIDLISNVNDVVRVANNASATANASLTQVSKIMETVDNTLVEAIDTINNTNDAKDKALEVVRDVKKAIAAGTHDLEVKEARREYTTLGERLDNLEKDLLNVKDTAIIPVTTESYLATVGETINGYLKNFKLEGKTLVVNSQNEEVLPGTEGANLKSVGDDVDEIAVMSTNLGNMIYKDRITVGSYINKNNGELQNEDSKSFCTNYFIEVSSNFKIKANQRVIFTYYDTNKDFVSGEELPSSTYASIPKNARYMKISFYRKLDVIDSIYVGFSVNNSDVNIQYDFNKKKVLCYDTETQTWKKPILREWDTIEEHSNGKYYYHKRSDESVLNGNENFQLYSQSLEDYVCFFIDVPNCLSKSDLICDKLPNVPTIYLESFVKEGIGVHPTLNRFYLKVLKSKLPSPDVHGFKTWLQVNPITAVYQLTKEEVYECTPIDLISYENETNYMIECGPIISKSSFKYEGYIGNVIKTLKEKVSFLEDKLYKTNLANFTVALNALDTKLKLEQLTKTSK